ncbi:S8 family serine peptidase [Galbibacter sp. EGI 63066]|uniref:S8 family serine peptidase n=1 Tax=Galbibacter sp. EGI 63066 TaxID=2993559 RepID=UPI002248BD54|nr:S8 family serine peptidase [Galbibacter sp. EGI 63066]MCX2681245.1 S8 family serine peptidase [Galbibacter sp. EGI 63066]
MKATLHKTVFTVFTVIVLFNVQDIFAQQTFQRNKHVKDIQSRTLKKISSKLRSKAMMQKEEAHSMAKRKGWEISKKLPNGGFMELEKIGPDGAPIYFSTFNDNIVHTSRSNALYQNGDLNLGVDGLGMYVGVWDSGNALMSHQEYGGRVQSGDDSNRTSGHATHVLGTILAAGVDPKAKGVAYNAEGVTFDWTNDEAEVAEAAANGLLLSNHSYGISGKTIPDWYFGAYIYQAQEWDDIMYNAPYYLMVTAAGNTQQYQYNEEPSYGTAADAYDLLLGYAVAKNSLTVAAADNIKMDANGNLRKADIAPFSNFGPTDDGRIKPDITGAGVDVYSSYSTDEKSYLSQSGTSMAAPGVTGSLLLLQQHYSEMNGGFMKAATLKGLALHTADEAGDFPGPDYKFGWGIINAKRAANTISASGFESVIKEETLAEGQTYSFTVNAEEGKTLMASISWTDMANENKNTGVLNDATAVLVNDLDVVITKEGDAHYPWTLSVSSAESGAQKGINNVDPFERIEIPNASGTYTVTVTHKGALTSGSQDFSVIVTGVKKNDCVLETPERLTASTTERTAQLEWEEVTDAIYEVAYRKSSNNKNTSDVWEVEVIAENKTILRALAENTTYEWKVRTLCSELAESEFSAIHDFKTKFVDIDAPEVPVNLNVSAVTQNSLELHWNASNDNVATAAYEVYMDGVMIGEVSHNHIAVDALQADTPYVFEVLAKDKAGNSSAMSEVFMATTLAEEKIEIEEPAQENTTVVSTQTQKKRISVYPNPTVDYITINGLAEGNDAYQIANASGTVVATGNGYNKNIDVSNYPSGLYVLTVREGGKTTGAKFVKH